MSNLKLTKVRKTLLNWLYISYKLNRTLVLPKFYFHKTNPTEREAFHSFNSYLFLSKHRDLFERNSEEARERVRALLKQKNLFGSKLEKESLDFELFFNTSILSSFPCKTIERREFFRECGKYLDTVFSCTSEWFSASRKDGGEIEKKNNLRRFLGDANHWKQYGGYSVGKMGDETFTSHRAILTQQYYPWLNEYRILRDFENNTVLGFDNYNLYFSELKGDQDWEKVKESVHFVDQFYQEAEKAILSLHLEQNYVCVHWRRSDFLYFRVDSFLKYMPENVIQSVKSVFVKNNLPQSTPVFLATDNNIKVELEKVESSLNIKRYSPVDPSFVKYDYFGAFIEQIICSKATFFIGTKESTFTKNIEGERILKQAKAANTNSYISNFSPLSYFLNLNRGYDELDSNKEIIN